MNLSYLFENCSLLNKLPDISKWETDNVENISCLFQNCSKLYSIPDISKWNLNKVSECKSPFKGCSSLIKIPDGIFSNLNINQIKKKSNINSILKIDTNENVSSTFLQPIPESYNSNSTQSNQGTLQPKEYNISQSQNDNNDDDPYDDYFK